MASETPTPLCDAQEYEATSVGPYDAAGTFVVDADFAHSLERRVAELEVLLEEVCTALYRQGMQIPGDGSTEARIRQLLRELDHD